VNLEIGLMTFDLQAVPGDARRAEEMGFGAIWSAEARHDPFLPLAIVSTTTFRLGLDTAIAVAFREDPMIVAHITWDLQKVSGGRFSLGLGSQVRRTTSGGSRWPGSRLGRRCARSSRPSGRSGNAGSRAPRSTSAAAPAASIL
jgi:alkanesulfonate monooxygenase SsuD/methylene tetrahydromethanopterin reductase-like flavin-dependent oxidoreductase (luciferase family)